MRLFDHFEIIAPLYDRLLPLRKEPGIIPRAGLPTRGWILDAGGGTGRVAQALRELTDQVVVVDISPGMLHQARQKDGLALALAQAERMPFPDAIFDRVVMVDALHHVESQVDTAGELWRVLKPGGIIVIEEPDVRTLIVKFVAIAEKLALMRSHFLSPPKIAALFSFYGASVRIERESYNAWVIVEKVEG